ncbi:major capsid protein [Capybara microvirus Cap1_SP_109]|nr:major capsid protein [Capybara microvirus Cap1_SP_109]
MSNFLSKIKERIAVSKSNKFDLSCSNITTGDFFRMKPVYTREVVPGSKYKINISTFTRLQPLVKPLYGYCEIVNRAFFVPYRTVMNGWNEFITDTKLGPNTKVSSVPTFTNANLVEVFKGSNFSTVVSSPGTYDYDFSIKSGSTVTYYQFTQLGRLCYDIMLNLGYSINFGDVVDTTVMSALPLLSYNKVWIDWYRNPSYVYYNKEKYDGGAMTVATLNEIFQTIGYINYEKDYFTSAWDNPNGPNDGSVVSSSVSIVDPSTNLSTTYSPTNAGGAPIVPMINGEGMTQYMDTALHRLTDYIKRHQLAGTRAMERFAARFGIVLSDAKLDRSLYLGTDKLPINIADVMNTAGPSDPQSGLAALGEYAGKGIGYGTGKFNLESDEYGQLIIVSVIQPKITYYQGRDREVTHVSRLQYYTPEFDGLGVQAIRKDELKADAIKVGELYSSYVPSGIFGYTSRYAEYKVPKDRITGDFRVNSRNYGLEVYHFGRDVKGKNAGDLLHSGQFCMGDGSQYDRVFSFNDSNYDHFITVFKFDVKAQLPMSKMFDDYEWCEDAAGRTQTLEIGGVQMN